MKKSMKKGQVWVSGRRKGNK